MFSLSKFIATIGENPNFIAFMAHSMTVAFGLSLLRNQPHLVKLGAVTVILLAALYKEYVFDLKEEQNPPQTIMDSTYDFIGYAVGIILGSLVIF